MNLEVKGCGCRYRDKECEHLCYEHMTEFILKLYNKNKDTEKTIMELKSIREWLKIADEINKQNMK